MPTACSNLQAQSHRRKTDRYFKVAQSTSLIFYMLSLAVLNSLVFEQCLMLIGIKIRNRELHKLQDYVLESSFSIELIFDIIPTLSSTMTHEIQQFNVIFETPVRFGIASILFAVFNLLCNINLNKPMGLLFIHFIEAIETNVLRFLLIYRQSIPNNPANQLAMLAVNTIGP